MNRTSRFSSGTLHAAQLRAIGLRMFEIAKNCGAKTWAAVGVTLVTNLEVSHFFRGLSAP